jgi:hypothetical protein
VGLADEIRPNREQRQAITEAGSKLDAELVDLIRRGYADQIPVPELARLAGVTRGRIYQILKPG